MRRSLRTQVRKAVHEGVRRAVAALPRETRFALFRALIDCNPRPDPRLTLKIAETQAELEACFALLHDAYVASGFMKPDPSGLRVTPYHALPTTTTLAAKFDGEVVGTMSLIREGVFGFPLQSAFDLAAVRAREGRIAEVSALAVHPAFRKTGGAILFPLMKFMYEYCTRYFDTRHLVIAVNPNKIELYESLLLFERLQQHVVDRYDFANGAPAVGATLDLERARVEFEALYGRRRERKNLYRYFVETRMPNIELPSRPYHTTNDPVMTPALLDHFFNRRTRVFESLDLRRKLLLHSIYDLPEYRAVLPPLPSGPPGSVELRRHRRYSLKCPARLRLDGWSAFGTVDLEVVDASRSGLQAIASRPLPLNVPATATVELGPAARSTLKVAAVRGVRPGESRVYGFRIDEADDAWFRCVNALERGQTHRDLEPAGVPAPTLAATVA
ncbi:MAG: GNAT family N-acetyltransferase [Rubrivivax sp.]|nr:GNAT family N-acetyltransferase [Rubrivivax sp.]